MSRRLVIVSEIPSPDVQSATIEGRSLYRLTRLMGLPHCSEVAKRYDARNLIPAPDPAIVSGKRYRKQAAAEMLPSLIGAPVILLGNHTATAFGLMPRPWCEWREVVVDIGTRNPGRLLYATVPHPSPSNRAFNDRAVMGMATAFLRRVRDEAADGSLYARAEALALEYAGALRRGEVDELLSITDVATILGATELAVEKLALARRIGHLKVTGGTRFRWEHVRAYQAAYEVPMAVVVRPEHPLPRGRGQRVAPDVGEASTRSTVLRRSA